MLRSVAWLRPAFLRRLSRAASGCFALLFIGAAVVTGRHIALGVGESVSHIESRDHRDVEFPTHDDHDCLICASSTSLLVPTSSVALSIDPDPVRRPVLALVDQRVASPWLRAHHSRSPPSPA